mmetsp:Transcript_17537/g.56554  ORF Transcript_17537/g.56554 Transcript_17537/m.56554 type:complete len:215 (-) Transcript_17537:83-727(-)
MFAGVTAAVSRKSAAQGSCSGTARRPTCSQQAAWSKPLAEPCGWRRARSADRREHEGRAGDHLCHARPVGVVLPVADPEHVGARSRHLPAAPGAARRREADVHVGERKVGDASHSEGQAERNRQHGGRVCHESVQTRKEGGEGSRARDDTGANASKCKPLRGHVQARDQPGGVWPRREVRQLAGGSRSPAWRGELQLACWVAERPAGVEAGRRG